MQRGGGDLGVPGVTGAALIGQGGSGRVYRASQVHLDRAVAVKIIPTHGDEAVLRRFDRERRAMGRLSSVDGIVTVYDAGTTDSGELFLVMPYLVGGSLKDRTERDGGLDWSTAAEVIEHVARAIDHAHDIGVFHRDIKPGNILMDAEDKALVTDFGIAQVAMDAGATRTAGLTLTPAFSPPEAFESSDGTRTRDVYSLGATLWALIAGCAPFEGDDESSSLNQILARVLTQRVASLRGLAPEPICACIEKAMSKDPKQRHQTALALADDLALSASNAMDLVPKSETVQVSGWEPLARVETASGDTAAPLPTFLAPQPASSRPFLPRRILAGACLVAALLSVGWVVARSVSTPSADQAKAVGAAAGLADAEPAVEEPRVTPTPVAEALGRTEERVPVGINPDETPANSGGSNFNLAFPTPTPTPNESIGTETVPALGTETRPIEPTATASVSSPSPTPAPSRAATPVPATPSPRTTSTAAPTSSPLPAPTPSPPPTVTPVPTLPSLTVSLSTNSIVCDGSAKPYGTMFNGTVGGNITFAVNPPRAGLEAGVVQPGGTLSLWWDCSATQPTVYTFVATDVATGRQTAPFSLTGEPT